MNKPFETRSPDSNRSIYILAVGTLAIAMGQSLLFAILPPLGRELGLQELQIGSIVTFSSMVFFLSSPRWGWISDRWGRKSVILTGLLGYTVGTLVFASIILLGLHQVITGCVVYFSLVISRMVQSAVMSATPPGSGAYIADVTDYHTRVAGLGKLGAATNLGTIIGPAIVGALAWISLLLPLYFAALTTFASALVVWRRLPESPQSVLTDHDCQKLRFLDKRYVAFFLVGFLMFMAFSVVMQTVAFYFQDLLGLDVKETARNVGIGLMASAVASLVSQGVIVDYLRWRPLRLLGVGMPIILGGFLGLVFSGSLEQLVFSLAVIGLGNGMAAPGLFAGASLTVTSEEQGGLSGIMNASTPLGFIVGPVVGTGLYGVGPVYPYVFISILFIPLILFVWNMKKFMKDNTL